ncbi:MAG: bacteriohemerythrin [Candidatus Thiodiazotropha sp.]
MNKPFFHWLDDWQLDLDCLDKQHHQIVCSINALHKAFVYDLDHPSGDGERIIRHLYTLSDQVRTHFKIEEYLMRTHEYPQLLAHRREHRFLLAELQVCIRDHEANRKPFNMDTLTALKHWLINHVISSDKVFAEYLSTQSQEALESSLRSLNQAQS